MMNDELKLPCLYCRTLVTEREDCLGYCDMCAGTVHQKSYIEHTKSRCGFPPPIRKKEEWERRREAMNKTIEAVKRKYFCIDEEDIWHHL